MLIPSIVAGSRMHLASLSRRVNANSQQVEVGFKLPTKLIKKGEC